MADLTRTVDALTEKWLLLGLSEFQFAPKLAGGGFGPFVSLGIVDTQELQKEIELMELVDRRSGSEEVVLEIVRKLAFRYQVGVFKWDAANLQLLLGSAELRAVAASTPSVVDEELVLTSDPRDFVPLANRLLVEPLTSVDAKAITDEAVGTGNGTLGTTLGDFALDFPVNVIGDVTKFMEGSTDRVGDLVAGSSPMAGEIGIVVGADADSGKIIYPAGEAPANGDAIVASYGPTFTFTENTDYFVDPKAGAVRVLTSTLKARAGQTLLVDYDHAVLDHEEVDLGTQRTFAGKARVRHLPDRGVRFVHDVPKASIRLTDDAITFDPQNPSVGTLVVNVLSDGTSKPFGTLEIYPEKSA